MEIKSIDARSCAVQSPMGYIVPVRRPGVLADTPTTPEPAPRDRRCLMLALAIAGSFAAGLLVGHAAPASGATLVETVDGSDVLVWNDQTSLVDGVAMLRSGAVFKHPRIVEAKLVCSTDSGSEVHSTGRPWHGTIAVTVLDGEAAGCNGTILSAQLKGGL